MAKTLELTLEKIENSKVYVHQNEMFKFKSPMDYLSPFLDEFNGMGVDWTFTAEKGSQNKNSEDDEEMNIAYSRLSAKAKLPGEFDISVNDPLFKHLFGEIGFVYALDTQKPEMKLYRGNRVSVCTNMTVFNASNILSVLLTSSSSTNSIYEKTKVYIDNALKEAQKLKEITERLSNEIYGERMVNEKFGQLMRLGISNPRLGTNVTTKAIESMLTKSSKYSIEENKTITAWKMYNSCTEEIKKSSILDEASRALILEKLFLNEN